MDGLKLLVSETEALEDGWGPMERGLGGFSGEEGKGSLLNTSNVVKFRPREPV